MSKTTHTWATVLGKSQTMLIKKYCIILPKNPKLYHITKTILLSLRSILLIHNIIQDENQTKI